MRGLDRKLVRDLWQMKGQVLAICLVIACGVATFVMSLSTLQTLQKTQAAYYERYRFAHVFAHLKRAPDTLAAQIAEIPGVGQVQTRVVVNVNLDVPGLKEPAVGRLVSIPEREAPGLNGLYLRRGRYIQPGNEGEVLASEGFVGKHRLQPGDTVTAIINGRKRRLRIVGVALSPEYIYSIREGDVLPDDLRYGVFWMGYTELAAAFNMQGAFNDLAVTLTPGASEADVISRIDRLTAPYGGLGAYGRADQPSHKFVANEINELRGMALVTPSIFLAVAAFILNVVISRLVNTQREQIATLKAFGYTRWEVGGHYLKMILVIVAVGVVLGTLFGARLGRALAEMYTDYFHFPVFEFHLGVGVVLLALAISTAAAVAGTLAAVWRATRLPPAQAMRPEPPAVYGGAFLERLGLERFFPPPLRMILRQIERRPGRALVSCLGIALAIAVLILGYFMLDAINYAMELQFQVAERHDLSVAFVEPTGPEALPDLKALPGVRSCEPFRAVPVRLRAGHRSRRLGLMGLRAQGELARVVDVNRRVVPLPAEGVVMSVKLAELLVVKPGDVVTVEVLEGTRPIRSLPVTAQVDDFAGTSAYMDLRALNEMMREGDLVSGAYLAVDPAERDKVYTALKNMPRVASVTIKNAALVSFRQTIAENLLRIRLFNIGFACVIAFGVVYNSARIALAERSRELATLRVIGFTRAEVSLLLLGELALVTLVAIPLGLALGYALGAAVIWLAYDTELFRIPLVINRPTYGFAALVVLLATVLSALVVRRLLDRLDLVAVLKSKE
jgi:putative ABC transport system permease protein